MITLYLEPESELQALAQKPTRLMDAVLNRVNAAADLVASKARENASGGLLQPHTGELAGSVQVVSASVSGGSASAEVTTAGDVAGIVQEVGSGAFEERPQAGTVMHFLAGGEDVFARYVEHPPIQPTEWFSGSLEEVESQIVEDMAAGIEGALEK